MKKKRLSREERRAHIIDAAITCMLRKGFHGTSMDSIAKQAGINIRIIYLHFSGKEEIIRAIVQRDVESTRIDLAEDEHSSSEQLIAKHVEGVGALVRRQKQDARKTLRLECYAEAARNPKVAAIVREGARLERELTRTLFRQTLRRPVADRELQARLDVLGVIFDGLLAYGLLYERHGRDEDALVEVLRPIMQSLFTGE